MAKMGKLITVENKLKKNGENIRYVALLVEDANGKNERCLLFTEIELADMETVSCPDLMDGMKNGRIYPVFIRKKEDQFSQNC